MLAYTKALFHTLLSEFLDQRILFGLIIAYVVAAHYIGAPDLKMDFTDHLLIFGGAAGFLVLLVSIVLIIDILVIDKPKRKLRKIRHEFQRYWLQPAFLFRGLIMLAFLYIFAIAFTSVKTAIPDIQHFGKFDRFFSTADKGFHLGFFPWEITHHIFPSALSSFVIDMIYSSWIVVLLVFFTWQAFFQYDERTRKTYFLSFFLCCIVIGSLFATLLSSAGPCYYAAVYPLDTAGNPYAALMHILKQQDNNYPIWSLNIQEQLWRMYRSHTSYIGGGISAMPNLHVSIALIQVFACFRLNKTAARLSLLYFLAILIGSVHLGWHYAVDGYIAIMLTFIIWRVSASIINRTTPAEWHQAEINP